MSENFSRQNLKGKSFRGKNLVGADFSYADIRGADFTNTDLTKANFSYAKAGQQRRWINFIATAAFAIFALSSYLVAYAGAIIGSLMIKTDAQPAGLWSGIAALIALIIFSFVIVKKGLGQILGVVTMATALVVIIAAATSRGDSSGNSIATAIVQSVAIAGAISGVVLAALAISTAQLLCKFAIHLSVILGLIGSVLGTLEGTGIFEGEKDVQSPVLIISSTVAFLLIGLGVFISSRLIAKDKKFLWVSSVAAFLASWGGTSFRSADLTDVDFTQASLKSVDFRKAILDRTCWFQSRYIESSRLQSTYLENSQIRQLVIEKHAPENNFDRMDLRGLNLDNADLQGASFISADFNGTNLRNANLAGSKLVNAQLYKTDLTEATLTGAYIQDWGISTETELNGVNCEYIYMRLPTRHDPDPCRKPDNKQEKFQEGDFNDFISPIIKTIGLYQSQNIDLLKVADKFKTLDLFHHAGIDPSAAAVTIQQVAQKYPEAQLEVISLQSGNEKIRLQAKVTDTADRSELSEEYFKVYERMKSLSYSDVQKLLMGIEEKDDRIRSLEKLLEHALQQPKFYAETYQNQGGFVMAQENKGNVNISDVQGSDLSGIAAAGENQSMTGVAMGAISGSVANMINKLPTSPDPDNPGIKELLVELQAAIEAEAALPDEEKAEALEQVRIMAEAGQKPEDNAVQKTAKTAMKILKGTVASLPDAAKLVEATSKLLPAIAALLALV